MKAYLNAILTLGVLTGFTHAYQNILDCPTLTQGKNLSPEQEFANSDCWKQAILAANSSSEEQQRIAWIPEYVKFSMMPFNVTGIERVTLRVDGTIYASQNWKHWPTELHTRDPEHTGHPDAHFSAPLWLILDSNRITVDGMGLIDGQGYMWWVREILNLKIHRRPNLVEMYGCLDVEWTGLNLKNSPRYHIMPQIINAYFHDFEIFVDIVGQFHITQLFWDSSKTMADFKKLVDLPGFEGIPLPTFPLNTDAIDTYGANYTFRRIKITNFDDAIVPKPSNKVQWGINCTQDILVEDCEVTYGVGMSIGSVPPHPQHNCVKNVIFRDIRFHRPLKAIYIKTNPGNDDGTSGEVTNITYENVYMTHPVWFGVYIGPQQMKQPDGDGPGCMLYPLEPCRTNPRVPFKDITLRNVTSTGSLLPPGIIRCNETNPCHGFLFENVQLTSVFWDLIGYGFITENVYGEHRGNTHPVPAFQKEGEPLKHTPSWADDEYGVHQIIKNMMQYAMENEFVKEMAYDLMKQIIIDNYDDLVQEISRKDQNTQFIQ